MSARFFAQEKPIAYKGPKATDGPAFRWYDPDKQVLGKRMEDQLRYAVCYWHSFTWPGGDPFGGETFNRPWMHTADPMEGARQKADVAFEMFRLLGVPFFTFHDRDIAPEGATLNESNRNVQHVLQPPLHGGRGDQSRPGGLRLCRGPGEERPRPDP